MEVNISLNFQFDDAGLKPQVADAFKAASRANNQDEILEAFSTLVNVNAKSALEKLIATYRAPDLLRGADIRVLKTKICFECVAPHDDEEFMENFMNYIVALGGRPLASKIISDFGEGTTYKFVNGKMSPS